MYIDSPNIYTYKYLYIYLHCTFYTISVFVRYPIYFQVSRWGCEVSTGWHKIIVCMSIFRLSQIRICPVCTGAGYYAASSFRVEKIGKYILIQGDSTFGSFWSLNISASFQDNLFYENFWKVYVWTFCSLQKVQFIGEK